MKRFSAAVALALVFSACQDADVTPTSASTTTTTTMAATTTTTVAPTITSTTVPTTTTEPKECTFLWEYKSVSETGVLRDDGFEGSVLGPDILTRRPALVALRYLRSYSEEGQLILVFTHDDPSSGTTVEVPLIWGPTSGYRDSTAFMPGLLLLYDPKVTGPVVSEAEPEYRGLSASEVVTYMKVGCMYPLLMRRESDGFFPNDPLFEPLVAATDHNNAVVSYLAGESGSEAVNELGAVGWLHIPNY